MRGETYRVGVEHTEPGRWVAYVFDLPGCFASGSTGEEATQRIPEAIEAYFEWCGRHGNGASAPEGFSAEVVEVLDADGRLRTTSLGVVHDVWAFFDDDRRPLTEIDAKKILTLLDYSRADLLASAPASPTEEIGRILLHVGSAEWWYLDRLRLAHPMTELSDDVFHRLDQVRSITKQVLSGLVEQDQVIVKDGETWSPRKLARRVIWHERDHTEQLIQVLSASGIRFLRERDAEAVRTRTYNGMSVMALLTNRDGAVLLNLRDDGPGVLHPGHWAIIGGGVEEGEDLFEALQREVREEIGYELEDAREFCRVIDWEGMQHLVVVYVSTVDAPISHLHLGEGREIRFFAPEQLEDLKITPFVRRVLKAYFDRIR